MERNLKPVSPIARSPLTRKSEGNVVAINTRKNPCPESRLLYDRKEAARQLSTSVRSLDYLIAAKKVQTIRKWAARNPITAVRTSAKRLRTPDILTAEEFQALIQELYQRERVVVLLSGSTGLRRGELFAFRWQDIDFELSQANVTHAIWWNVEGNTKTEASRKPVPLPGLVVEQLIAWRSITLYQSDSDYLFPSVVKNGKQPISPDTIEQIGVTKQIGYH
jgi:integrase